MKKIILLVALMAILPLVVGETISYKVGAISCNSVGCTPATFTSTALTKQYPVQAYKLDCINKCVYSEKDNKYYSEVTKEECPISISCLEYQKVYFTQTEILAQRDKYEDEYKRELLANMAVKVTEPKSTSTVTVASKDVSITKETNETWLSKLVSFTKSILGLGA